MEKRWWEKFNFSGGTSNKRQGVLSPSLLLSNPTFVFDISIEPGRKGMEQWAKDAVISTIEMNMIKL